MHEVKNHSGLHLGFIGSSRNQKIQIGDSLFQKRILVRYVWAEMLWTKYEKASWAVLFKSIHGLFDTYDEIMEEWSTNLFRKPYKELNREQQSNYKPHHYKY